MMSNVMDLAVDVCPTEDALGALLEYLVDPKLPSESAARTTPTQLEQELIGKQVHAVVLVYNYYYRKQHPHIEFLGFENFCKLVVILRPTLMVYLKLMQLSNETELDDLVKDLSVAENMIMNACDISTSLDASKNAPSTEGLPISKVAVLLTDSKNKNCLLKFGSITEGVWSLIEKDVDLSYKTSLVSINPEPVSKKKRFIKKPVKNGPDADDAGLQKLAYSVVKEITGINQDALLILESHVVYSTSKEKAATRFYIMQCTQPENNEITQVLIRDALNSLQGPLFVRNSSQWMHTSVVEYFHLLPYAKILLDWLSGESGNPQVQKSGPETISIDSSKRVDRPCFLEAPKSSHGEHLQSKEGSGSTKQYDDDGPYAVDFPEDCDTSCKMDVDESLVVHDRTKVKGTNGVKMASSLKRQKITRDGPAANGNKNCKKSSSDQDGVALNGNVMVKNHSKSNDLDKIRSVIASKDKELSQAAVKVILSKRAKLCLQLRDIEDQIAQCDQNIKIISNGGEGDLVLKIETLIECCNDKFLRIPPQEIQHCNDQYSTPSIESTRLPANGTKKQNPCQELDELCYQKNWILPTYRVSALDGGFEAGVTVKGKDDEYSAGGDVQCHPHEARESAAKQMLYKLQTCQLPADI
ncbi:uncharacterized protein LOC126665442 isoform X2 [Mercurialis annua]|uniref:uncharacterized protein LOC126665442 isoform X2 n=1 Tax=Mercurialis annua TaxID=3986 RepID=UPI0024AEE63D|nr:uncharacterized protein LOC126665442 isoform X2 [Mercurialis annua]